MTIKELSALLPATHVLWSDPYGKPREAIVMRRTKQNVHLRWVDNQEEFTIDRHDGESDEMLAWLTVVNGRFARKVKS